MKTTGEVPQFFQKNGILCLKTSIFFNVKRFKELDSARYPWFFACILSKTIVIHIITVHNK